MNIKLTGRIALAAAAGLTTLVVSAPMASATPITTNDASPLVMSVDTSKPGSSDTSSFTIPTNSQYNYNYNVDWESDGTIDQTGLTGDVTHIYGDQGVHKVSISGDFPTIQFGKFQAGAQGTTVKTDAEKLLSVDAWGSQKWLSFADSFAGCSNLLKIAPGDTPDLSNVTDLSGMFSGDRTLIGNLGDWNWNTSTVTNMSRMFENAANFEGDLIMWDTAKVTNMTKMFSGATDFNTPIGGWDTSNVVSMVGMFKDATSFNGDLSAWNLDKVTTTRNSDAPAPVTPTYRMPTGLSFEALAVVAGMGIWIILTVYVLGMAATWDRSRKATVESKGTQEVQEDLED